MPFVDGFWVDDPEEEKPPEQETPPAEDNQPLTKSILSTVKKMLGISEDHHAFDLDVIMDINACFLTLNQLGIGPRLPYRIEGSTEVWTDFLGDQDPFLAAVQTYIYMRVRLMFDPPSNSFLVDSMQKQIQELEWRFTVQPKDDNEVSYIDRFKQSYKKEEASEENQNGSSNANISTFSMNDKKSIKKSNPSLYEIFG